MIKIISLINIRISKKNSFKNIKCSKAGGVGHAVRGPRTPPLFSSVRELKRGVPGPSPPFRCPYQGIRSPGTYRWTLGWDPNMGQNHDFFTPMKNGAQKSVIFRWKTTKNGHFGGYFRHSCNEIRFGKDIHSFPPGPLFYYKKGVPYAGSYREPA